MKLYYFTGSCALSPHIVALEAGIDITTEKIDHATHKTATGVDFYTISDKGAVPALQLDDGRLLTEGAVIVQYLADQAPDSGLVPRAGTFERYQTMELLNYLASDIHKGFSPLFNPTLPAEWRETTLAALTKQFDWLCAFLGNKPYLMGERFTVPDAYLFTMLGWTKFLKIDLTRWPLLAAYQARVSHRPHVQEAMRAEGLIK